MGKSREEMPSLDFFLFIYLTKQHAVPRRSNLLNNFLLTPKFYSWPVELATQKQTLADEASSNAVRCVRSALVLEEVHWILQAKDARGDIKPYAPAQDVPQRDGVLNHTHLSHEKLF